MLLEAASVGYHLLSPTSENLFNRAAMHSGTPIDTFLFDSKVSTITRAMDLAELVNCNRSDVTLNPKRLQKCLQDVPASLFNDTHVKMKLLQPLTYSFIPTVDDYFISETPNELLKQGKFKKTEVIIGTVKTDGAYFLPIYFPEYFTSGFPTMQQIENMIKRLYPSLSEAQLAGVALKYFGNLSPHHARYATNEAGYMVSDTRFICPTTYFAECMTKFGGKAFYYRFTHQKSGSTDWITVPHGAELAYIFGIAQENNGFTKAEKDLSERLMSQWANFAKTGTQCKRSKLSNCFQIGHSADRWRGHQYYNRTTSRSLCKKQWELAKTAVLLKFIVFYRHLETHVFVKTSTGSVKGKLERKNNVILATFLGIPYAKPPVDRRRFARPEAIDLWHGTLNATTYKPDCFQIHGRNGNEVNEDCLYLNIWSPTNGASNLLPVFFYIHGGGFNQGTAHIPGLTFSSRSGCVIVSVSYRLNTFGFLNLYIDEVPGNMGLLDQQMALKWVKKNIEQFGGNSNDITLFGFSAGSASVGYHLLSPTSENLFNRAAMHSGTQIDTFLFDSKVSTITRAMDLAELVNCNRSDVTLNPKRLQKCLQNVPASLFNDTHVKMKLLQPLAHTFKPTVDDYLISETPNELLKQGKFKKAEVIIGTVKTDGAYFLPMYFPEYFTSGFPTMQQIENMIKRLYPSLSEAQLAVVALKYFGNLSPHHARYATNEAGYMFGDTRFICPTTYFAECMTKFGGKAFYYRFTHQKSGSTDWITVPHGAELAYIFGVAQENNGFTKAEKNLSKRLISSSTENTNVKTLFDDAEYSVVQYYIDNMNKSIEKYGRIKKSDVIALFDDIKSGTISSEKIILLFRSCGSYLAEEIPANRRVLVTNIWNYLKDSGIELDVSIFNALLRTYLDNGNTVSHTGFLAEMSACGVEPNKVTYQRFLKLYCEAGKIQEAGNILQIMKEKDIPIGISVMNSLIRGHARANDMAGAQNMFHMMSNLNLTPSEASYTELLCGFADKGDDQKMKVIFEELNEKNIRLSSENYYAIIKSLAKNGENKYIREILQTMPEKSRFTQTASNNVVDLINHKYITAAYDVYANIVTNSNYPVDPVFLRQLILINDRPEIVSKYCSQMITDKIDHHAYFTAVQQAYLQDKYSINFDKKSLGLQLLHNVHAEGVLMQPHYYWPAIVDAGKKNDQIGQYRKHFETDGNRKCVSIDTLADFIYPSVQITDPLQLFRFARRNTNFSAKKICNSMVKYLFAHDRYEDASLLLSRYPTDLEIERSVRDLARATTTEKIDTIMEILEHARPGISEANDRIHDLHGIFLINCLKDNNNDISRIEPVIKAMSSKKLRVLQRSVDLFKKGIEEKLSQSPQISEMLQQLVASEDDIYLPYKYNITMENSEEYKELVTEMEKNYSELKNIDRVMELKKEYEDYGFKYSSLVSSRMIRMLANNDRMEDSMQLMKEFEALDPSLNSDEFKFQHINLLIKKGNIDEAILQFKLIQENENFDKDEFKLHVTRILRTTAEKGEVETTLKIFNTVKEFESLEISKPILDIVMKSFLVSGDLDGALKFFKECSFMYAKTPLSINLMVQFINKEDTENLKDMVKILVENVGELLSMHYLGFAFIESGKVDQAKKIFDTPGIKAHHKAIESFSKYLFRNNMPEQLKNLLAATKNLKDFDRLKIYQNTSKLYESNMDIDAKNNLDKAMEVDDTILRKNKTEHKMSSIEINLKKSLFNKDVEEAVKIYQSGYVFSPQTTEEFLECLFESDYLNTFSIAKKVAIDDNNYQPLDVFWNHYVITKDFEKVDALLKEFPDLKNNATFGAIIAKYFTDEESLKILLNTVEKHDFKPIAISKVKSSFVISFIHNNKPDEALAMFEQLKNSQHFKESFGFPTLRKIRTLQYEGKEVPSQISEYVISKLGHASPRSNESKTSKVEDSSSSSSSDSSDDETSNAKYK
ncbi:Cholinesterase [Nymphon striatum]|nr:Cholinesterase [Nymphon striatum]